MGQDNVPEREYGRHAASEPPREPEDVLLDIPTLHVGSLELEVDDLRARVSLQAEVLNLLRLNVGVDAALGRVRLDLRDVDAQALLKVRLDRVAEILNRVLETLDHHPEIIEPLARATATALEQTGRGLGSLTGQLGGGAGEALRQVGEGAGQGLGQVGQGAGQGLGQGLSQVGQAAGQAGQNVGQGVGQGLGQAGQSAAQLAGTAGQPGPAPEQGQGRDQGAQQGGGDQGAEPEGGRRETRRWSAQASPPEQPSQTGEGNRPTERGEPSIEACATVEADWTSRQGSGPGDQRERGEPGQPEQRGGQRRYRGLPRRSRRRW